MLCHDMAPPSLPPRPGPSTWVTHRGGSRVIHCMQGREEERKDGGGGMGVGWRGVRGGDERGRARRQIAAQPQRWRSLRVCRGALHKARGEPYIPPYIGCSHVLIGSPDVPLAGVRVAQWPWGNRRLRPSACVRSNTYTQVLGIPADVRVNVTEPLLG